MAEIENALIKTEKYTVYQSDIDSLCDEYLESLPNADMIYSKSAVFNGLLDYIYKHCLKRIIGNKQGFTGNRYDYQLLDLIFDEIYIPLTYRFNKTPTVLQFCVLCHMDSDQLSDIVNGFYRSNGSTVNKNNSQIAKKWHSVCESGLASKAIDEASIGAMFGLKSLYQWRDSDNTVNLQVTQLPVETPESIAEKYSDAKQPKMIDLTE